MTVEVCAPTEADVEAIFPCVATYGWYRLGTGAVADIDFPADAIFSVRNRVVQVDLRMKCSIARRGEEVLGFCCWDWYDESARSAKTILLCVVPTARELGIGSMLQQRRMAEMRKAGARELHTWSVDPKSVKWYERHFGYRTVGLEPLRHSLHRWYWDDRSYWGIHRGQRQYDELTHLVANLESEPAS